MTKEQIDEALKSDNRRIRCEAIIDSNATKEHLDIGITDKDEDVRSVAIVVIRRKVPQNIIDIFLDMDEYKFLGTKEDWDNICLLYL